MAFSAQADESFFFVNADGTGPLRRHPRCRAEAPQSRLCRSRHHDAIALAAVDLTTNATIGNPITIPGIWTASSTIPNAVSPWKASGAWLVPVL